METLELKNPNFIRETLIKRLYQEYPEGAVHWKYDVPWLWELGKTYFLMQILIRQESQSEKEQILVEGKNIPICGAMAETDYLQIPLYAAAATWLTVDDWRLENHFDFCPQREIEPIPEGLSYGLVLQYPAAVLRACAYIAGLSQETFTESQIEKAEKHALRYVSEGFIPELRPEEIQARVQAHHARLSNRRQ